jgi:hypothetical protein
MILFATNMIRKNALLLSLAMLLGCSNAPSEDVNSFDFAKGKKLAELKNKKLEEASGLASSINNKGYLWTHNDSGNGPNIFLIDTALNVKLKCTLRGIKNRDWEDIAVGPGPDESKNYIYVGDIGDNNAQYQYKYIYRFEEPKLAGESKEIVVDQYDKITFQLQDKKKDCEALLINPLTKDLFLISKREEPVFVYTISYPQSTTDTLTAAKGVSLPFTQIVAGDFSADGKEVLLKNYQNIYYWKIAEGQSIDDVFSSTAKILPYEEEPQGEAITFARDASGFYTISEKVSGEQSYLQFYKRNAPAK